MVSKSLIDVISSNIQLEPPNNKGWQSVLCKVCNDHGKKGKRAAFRFDNNVVGYHCFNCDTNAVDDPLTNKRISKQMRLVLEAFNVPSTELQSINLSRLNTPEARKSLKKEKKRLNKIKPKTLPVPSFFYPLALAKNDDIEAAALTEYIKNERLLDPDSYVFLRCKPIKPNDPPKIKVAKSKWLNRVITPIYFKDNVIFWEGRDITGKSERKYESASEPKAKVMFGFEHILDHETTEPIFVMEGLFDAMLVNGVAILGNKLSDEKIIWLHMAKRPVVYVPDMWGDGDAVAQVALSEGWNISIPNMPGCKDITEGFKKYGRLFIMKELHNNICSGFQAEIKLKLTTG